LGIYSQILLKVELEMIDQLSGEVVWKKTATKRSHEGGIPFNPFGIIPAALRSGFHMKEERTIELVNRMNRELAGQIPEPPSPTATPYYIEIQVASFLENNRAQKILMDFEGRGLNPRIETVTRGDKLWHRIILGPYFNLQEAEKIKNRIAQNTQFRPIFIHHYPETPEKEHLAN
ncbi:SPOR domain-containing protein, partial [Thermodesulfobacteriota bacterium]